ncbi:MAG: hypothetical protein K1X28_06815 [Parachlamydiales bacterium]|nr:hypothetical protein [Parachlamydiales bacterium]
MTTVSAIVSFKEKTICVSNGHESRATKYQSNSYENQMLVQIIKLEDLGTAFKYLDIIPNLKERLIQMRKAINNVAVEVATAQFAKMDF